MSDNGASGGDNPNHQQPNRQKPFAKWSKYVPDADITTAFATFLLVVVGAWGVVETKHALNASERAWVSAIDVNLQSLPIENQPIRMSAQLSNSGKDPALDVNYVIPVEQGMIDKPAGSDFTKVTFGENSTCAKYGPIKTGGVIPPNMTNIRTSDSGRGDVPIYATPEFMRGEKLYWVMGCVAYRTVEEVHHTAYCFIIGVIPPSAAPVAAIPPQTPPANPPSPDSQPKAAVAPAALPFQEFRTTCNSGNWAD